MSKKAKKEVFRQPKENEQPDIFEVFEGYNLGDWVQCVHCQRVYKVGEFRVDKDGLQWCPYEGCSGDAVFDVWHWVKDFQPVRDVIYDL